MSSISSFDIINVVVPKPVIYSYILASAANAAAVSPNGIKALSANVAITLFIKGYLGYKTITSQNMSSEAQIKNFFIS